MARRSARDAKENYAGQQAMNQNYATVDESSFVKQQDEHRYSMNYFYDIDQSCVDQLKEFLHQKSGNDRSVVEKALGHNFTLEVAVGFRVRFKYVQ